MENFWSGVIVVSDTGLEYPAYVSRTAQPGAIKIASSSGNRSLKRDLETPLGNRSFYFSVLMSYSDLSSYATGRYAVWGLTKTQSSGDAYPADDGILVGFEKTSSGVDAILRVDGQSYTIQSSITPDTYQFVGFFEFNNGGNDTVYASVNPGDEVPVNWDVSTSTELLLVDEFLPYVNFGVNNNPVYADEWCIGDSYPDTVGSDSASPAILNLATTNIVSTSGWVNGYLTSTGTSETVVSVYYGNSNGSLDTETWDSVYVFPGIASTEPQYFTWQDTGVTPEVRRYYRFAASNDFGLVWSPTVADFFPSESSVPAITNVYVTDIEQTTATLVAELTLSYPETAVYACWDSVDQGMSNTGLWANVEYVGSCVEAQPVVSHPISGLPANGSYAVRFYAVNAEGDAWSSILSNFTTDSPMVSITDVYGNEGDSGTSPIQIAISLDTASAIDTVIYYQTADDTAIADVNYIPVNTSLTIPAGVTSTNLTMLAIGNTVDEFPGKGFWVNITSADDLTIGTATAQVGILDDDMGKLLFSDDFSDGNDDGWTRVLNSDKWSVVNNAYRYGFVGSQGGTQAGDSQWGDYGMRVMMSVDANWQSLGIYCRGQGDDYTNRYSFTFAKSDDIRITSPRVHAGSTVLASDGSGNQTRLDEKVLRPVSMRVNNTPEGVRIRCYVEFTEIYDVFDTENTYTSGMIGLIGGTWMYAYFDNIEVFSDAPTGTILILQ